MCLNLLAPSATFMNFSFPAPLVVGRLSNIVVRCANGAFSYYLVVGANAIPAVVWAHECMDMWQAWRKKLALNMIIWLRVFSACAVFIITVWTTLSAPRNTSYQRVIWRLIAWKANQTTSMWPFVGKHLISHRLRRHIYRLYPSWPSMA
jgi:hypothetical protein